MTEAANPSKSAVGGGPPQGVLNVPVRQSRRPGAAWKYLRETTRGAQGRPLITRERNWGGREATKYPLAKRRMQRDNEVFSDTVVESEHDSSGAK